MIINFPPAVHSNPQGQELMAQLKQSIEESIPGASVQMLDYDGPGGAPGAPQPQPGAGKMALPGGPPRPGAPLGRLPVGGAPGAPPPLTGAGGPPPLPASPLGGGMTPGPQRPLPQRPMPTQRRTLG
jgi:hypothetical protein